MGLWIWVLPFHGSLTWIKFFGLYDESVGKTEKAPQSSVPSLDTWSQGGALHSAGVKGPSFCHPDLQGESSHTRSLGCDKSSGIHTSPRVGTCRAGAYWWMHILVHFLIYSGLEMEGRRVNIVFLILAINIPKYQVMWKVLHICDCTKSPWVLWITYHKLLPFIFMVEEIECLGH